MLRDIYKFYMTLYETLLYKIKNNSKYLPIIRQSPTKFHVFPKQFVTSGINCYASISV